MLKNALRSAADGKPRLFFLGQAGFAVKSGDGKLLVIDPYLTHCVRPLEGNDGFKRLIPAPIAPEELEADVIVATHPHYDHFDVDAMPALMEKGKAAEAAGFSHGKYEGNEQQLPAEELQSFVIISK